MKLAHLFGASLCLGLVLPGAVGQIATNCVPTKHQVTLRQRVAELDASEGKLDAAKFKAEITALRQQGKIDEAQYAELEKVVEKAEAAKGPMATAEGQEVAYAALNDKVEELELAQAQTPDEDAEIRAKADEALAEKMTELKQVEAAAAATTATQRDADAEERNARQAAAEAALAEQMAELNEQKPQTAATSSDDQAVAQAALAAKMVELSQAEESQAEETQAEADADAKAQAALARKMAELEAQEEATEPVAVAAPAPDPAPSPAPVAASAAAVAVATVPAEDDRQGAAQEALDSKMTEMRQAENRAITGIPVQPVPASPQEKLQAEQTLHRTMKAPSATTLPASTKTGLERLEELTDLYRQGEMTPEEYHRERAKIVGSLSQ
jgi:hypothetical protein